jgi:hypothetical protein
MRSSVAALVKVPRLPVALDQTLSICMAVSSSQDYGFVLPLSENGVKTRANDKKQKL